MKNNYIVIGDSITYGIGDFNNNGWTSLFKNYIVNKDNSKECSNYVHIVGFPGATSNDILNKIDSIIKLYKHNEYKNIVILSIGINDTQEFNGTEKNSIDDFLFNIKEIIKIITSSNCKLIVLGITRIESNEKFYWKPNKYYDNTVINKYDKELREICNSNEIKYISMKDVLEKDDYIDGLHPNSNGHRKIFEWIRNNL